MIWKKDESLLENNIDILKSYLSQFSSISILNNITTIINTSENLIESTGLHSPYKLYLYLLGLLFSTKDSENIEFDENSNDIIKKHLNEIENIYVRMFFRSQKESKVKLPKSWYDNRTISMPVFMQYFSEAELASDETILERIKSYYIPYNDIIFRKFGFTITDAINLYFKLQIYVENKFKSLMETKRKINDLNNEIIEIIPKRKFTLKNVSKKFKSLGGDKIVEKFLIEINEIYIANINEYLEYTEIINFFLLVRKKRDFRYYTESNIVENYPIFKIDEKRIFIGLNRQFLISLYNRLNVELKKSDQGQKFLIRRDKYLEDKTSELFNNFDKVEIYKNSSEDSKGNNEHDIIIKSNSNLIICECKATERKEPFRDPDKAAERIIRQFKSNTGIQKGFDQGNNLRKKILKKKIKHLFNEKKEIVIDFTKEQFDEIYCIVITLDNFGYLATNLSLLEKEDNDPYPLCINVADLEYLILGYNYLHKGIDDFLNYLNLRNKFHDNFMTTDELEIAGFHLMHNGFDKLIETGVNKWALSHEMADIFIEAYYSAKGIKIQKKQDLNLTMEILNKDNLADYIKKNKL